MVNGVENNKVLSRNLAGMERFKPNLYRKCVEALTDKATGRVMDTWQSDYVFTDDSAENEKIIGVVRDSRKYYLNSRYKAKGAANVWGDQFDDISYKTLIIINGMSNGMHIKETALRTGKENIIFVFEPDIDIFMTVVCNIDIVDIIEDTRIAIFINGFNMETFRATFRVVYSPEMAELVRMAELPGYSRLYRSVIDNFIEKYCQKEMDIAYIERNTIELYGEEMVDNILMNMWDLCKASSIDILKKSIQEKCGELENIPAIIVSAGPSLDKNVDELKNAKGKALIIAVDSAVSKLLVHGIVPSIVITVDSHKPLEIFKGSQFKKIPVVVCGQTRHVVLVEHTGRVVAFSGDSFMYEFFHSEGVNVEGMETGGSVANNAFTLAEYLGFKRIILVGQDLAFSDNKKHTSEYISEKEIGDEEDSEYAYVEGIDGSMMLTYANFKMYKEWFENRIVDNRELTVINATGGGARINGAVHADLKETIEKYCVAEFDEAVIASVPYIFDNERLNEVCQSIFRIVTECDRYAENFAQGIELYTKMKKLIRYQKTDTAEFRKLVQKTEMVTALGNEPICNLLSMYTKKDETELLSGMYQEDESIEGALAVIDRSIEILKVYCKALEKIKSKVELLIENEVSKDCYEISEYTVSFIDKSL